MCEAFRQSGGAPLTAYWTLGTIGWTDSGAAETTASFGYPANCPGYTITQEYPSFVGLTTLYAPPGCTPSATGYKCTSPFQSSVQYATGSTTGTTSSTQKSFKATVTLTAKTGGLEAGVGFSNTAVEGSSSTVTKVATKTLTDSGGLDGIDHYNDIVYLLLNSVIDVGSWTFGGNIYKTWAFSTEPLEVTYPVYLSEVLCALAGFPPPGTGLGTSGILAPLNTDPNFIRIIAGQPQFVFPDPITYDPQGACNSSNPPALLGQNKLPGLNYDDLYNILKLDLFWPLAVGQPTVAAPAERFVPQFAVGYVGPNGTSCIGQTWQLMNATTQAYTGSMTWDYMTSLGFGSSMTDLLNVSFDFSDQISNAYTTQNSQTATANLSCHSAAYTGPSYVEVLFDQVFGTFLFSLNRFECHRVGGRASHPALSGTNSYNSMCELER